MEDAVTRAVAEERERLTAVVRRLVPVVEAVRAAQAATVGRDHWLDGYHEDGKPCGACSLCEAREQVVALDAALTAVKEVLSE